MPRTKLFRMVPEMGDMLNEIRKQHKLKNNVEASRFLCSHRKKGSVLDLFPLLVILFTFSFGIVLAYVVMNGYDAASAGYLGTTGDHIVDKGVDAISYMDQASVFVLFGLFMAVLVGCYYMRSHPIMLGVTMFVLVFALFVSGVMSDVYTQLTGNALLADSAAHFPTMSLVWENMPVIILIVGALIMIAIYSFSPEQGGGLQ